MGDRLKGAEHFRLAGRAVAVCLAMSLMLPLSSLAAQQVRPSGGGTNSSEVESELLPGDLIRLSGTRETELPGDYPVDETGTVVLPLLGARSIAGVAPGTLKEQLRAAYREQLRNQEVQIALLRRVRVLGAVKNPGIYHVDPTMSVADAIALAGGATDEGKLTTVRIVRAGKTIRSNVDKDAPLSGGLRSGDQIMVPERSWMSRNGKFVVGGLLSAVGIVVAASIR